MSEYFDQLRATLDGVVAKLTAKGIESRHLAFGGEGEVPKRKPTVPTDARSEFLANRAMGDWAEQALSAALLTAFPEWRVVQYGDTNRIAAGHPDFKASYLAGIEGTRRYGKRPDLLLFPASIAVTIGSPVVVGASIAFDPAALHAVTATNAQQQMSGSRIPTKATVHLAKWPAVRAEPPRHRPVPPGGSCLAVRGGSRAVSAPPNASDRAPACVESRSPRPARP